MFPNLDIFWVFQLQATTSPPDHAPLMSLTQQGSQVFLSPSPFCNQPNILSLLPHPSLRQDTNITVHTATSLSLTHTQSCVPISHCRTASLLLASPTLLFHRYLQESLSGLTAGTACPSLSEAMAWDALQHGAEQV